MQPFAYGSVLPSIPDSISDRCKNVFSFELPLMIKYFIPVRFFFRDLISSGSLVGRFQEILVSKPRDLLYEAFHGPVFLPKPFYAGF